MIHSQDNVEIDWNKKNSSGDPLMMTVLKNDSFEMFKILSTISSIDWDLTNAEDETVFRDFLIKLFDSAQYLETFFNSNLGEMALNF